MNKETNQAVSAAIAKTISRDERGLLVGYDYKYNEDGMIDWKQMIPPKFLYVNNSNKERERIEKKYGKPYSEIDPISDNVADSDLIIMLGGIKHLLRLRGFNSVKPVPVVASPTYASVNCTIQFIGNFETEGRIVEYSDNSCATLDNTTNFAQNYLVEMATNRAFCRAVRSFLNVNIVSKEELGKGTEEAPQQSGGADQVGQLQSLLTKRGITFDQLKAKLVTEGYAEAKNASKLDDLDKNKIFELISRIQKSEKAAK